MKTALAILLSSCCLTFGAATVNFYLQDSFSRPLPLRKVTLTPVPTLFPPTNGTGQVTGDYLTFNTDTNANATVSNVLAGTYQQVTFGPTATTTNYLLIPNTNGTINARDCITLYPTGLGFIMYEEAGVIGGRIVFEP